MNEEGKCESIASLNIFVSVRPFLNMIRRRGTKWVFMMVDDLWLYQYHEQEYDGIIKDVFETISLIEERQWEIVGLQRYAEEVKGSMKDLSKYNPHSNEKFMREARNNNVLLDSLIDFLLFSVPLTLLMEFLFYRLFFLLFDY